MKMPLKIRNKTIKKRHYYILYIVGATLIISVSLIAGLLICRANTSNGDTPKYMVEQVIELATNHSPDCHIQEAVLEGKSP